MPHPATPAVLAKYYGTLLYNFLFEPRYDFDKIPTPAGHWLLGA